MKRMVALALAACMAVSSATVSFAASSYDYIEFGGWVTLDYDVLDGGNVLVPGNEYRIPILDGSDYFNEDSADVWKISASEYVPAEDAEDGKAGNKKFSEVDVVKGSDGIYYLTLDVKRNLDTYDGDQTAYILIKVEEKGIDREDAEINRSMAAEYEGDTADMIDAARLDSDTSISLRNLQRYSEEDPTGFDGGFIDGLSLDEIDPDGEEAQTLESGDRVYTTTISVEEFEIASTDYDVIDDDEYDVDNSMPLVMAGGDVSRSLLHFGNTAEYLGKFSSSRERPFDLSYSTVTNSEVASDNPNADLVCISFPGRPSFAANSDLVIKDKDMNYLYEVERDGSLTELDTTTTDEGYLAYRTIQLTSYVASDIRLKNVESSSETESSSSSSSSSSSTGSTGGKVNPDTGR